MGNRLFRPPFFGQDGSHEEVGEGIGGRHFKGVTEQRNAAFPVRRLDVGGRCEECECGAARDAWDDGAFPRTRAITRQDRGAVCAPETSYERIPEGERHGWG